MCKNRTSHLITNIIWYAIKSHQTKPNIKSITVDYLNTAAYITIIVFPTGTYIIYIPNSEATYI